MVTLQVNLCGKFLAMINQKWGLLFTLDFVPRFGGHRQCLDNVFPCLLGKVHSSASLSVCPRGCLTGRASNAMHLSDRSGCSLQLLTVPTAMLDYGKLLSLFQLTAHNFNARGRFPVINIRLSITLSCELFFNQSCVYQLIS